MHGDAAGVIAAVLQAAQTLDQDRNDVAGADGADDSTHVPVSLSERVGAAMVGVT
jgi:hypothetical protein